MELGWIDFSNKERNKVLSVFDLLGDKGVLDELGIAPIRDAFSNRFFPGTSTIQTRAKYFLIVPYTFKELELNEKINPVTLNKLKEIENETANVLLKNNPGKSGIIGINAIRSENWVKRPPSSVYWAGLRRYKIFNDELMKNRITIPTYIKYLNTQKQERSNIKKLTYQNEEKEISDDKNAGLSSKFPFFNVPTYKKGWMEKLDICLTSEEGKFLKEKIITNCKGSMMAYILDNEEDMGEILTFKKFSDLKSIINIFPEDIQLDYQLALSFSEFNFILNVVYNYGAFDGKNENVNSEFRKIKRSIKSNIDKISEIDIDFIMSHLRVKNKYLNDFLNESKEFMIAEDFDGLKNRIKDREIVLKGENRSRLCHPNQYNEDEWFAGKYLDYRFPNAKTIIKDIFDSKNNTGDESND